MNNPMQEIAVLSPGPADAGTIRRAARRLLISDATTPCPPFGVWSVGEVVGRVMRQKALLQLLHDPIDMAVIDALSPGTAAAVVAEAANPTSGPPNPAEDLDPAAILAWVRAAEGERSTTDALEDDE